MEDKTIETRKKTIENLIEQRRLKEAFAALAEIAAEASDWHVRSKVEELEQSYKYMVQYAAEGIDDPQREAIYDGIVAKAYELCDEASNELVAKTSPKLHYGTLRIERMHPESLPSLLSRYGMLLENLRMYESLPKEEKDGQKVLSLREECEMAASRIFKHIWVAYPVCNEDLEAILATMGGLQGSSSLGDLIVAAVMLNLLEHYSENLLVALLDIYMQGTDTAVKVKSLCCALIVMYKYRNIVGHSRQLALRMKQLADDRQAVSDMMMVFLQFIRSRGTERIIRKVQTELVPEIMKLKPELQRKLRGMDLSDDPESLAANPDWQEMLDKSGITAKMQELNQMQAEGSDVFLSSFARLKNFPFFNSISNWFLPFDMGHSAVSRVFGSEKTPWATIVGKAGVFCDSDKYSFALSVASVPEQQRAMMLGQFDEQNAQLMELSASELPDTKKERENIANKYMQNLYRFFNLFSRKSEFYNPFKTPLNLIEVPFVKDMLSDVGSLSLIAEFYFKQECFPEALALFRRIAGQQAPGADIYQKMGFCHEHAKRFAEAVECYEKVDILKENDIWTLKHLAACHRADGKIEKAVEYYKRVETLQPQNAAVANNLGNCLLEAGNPQEALKYYFKADYIANKGVRTMRPIAWCSFLVGNYGQSIDYYNRIIAFGAIADDYINRGHAQLGEGRIKEAVASYEQAVKSGCCDLAKLMDTIGSDKTYLPAAMLPVLPVLLDKIRYDLQ